ncbi:tryptophan synthase subunit alpha [Psychrilyobacter atlanticus]|uniref:tryptophan synthase subunit alpha n=1 Tax=Psychrilyobacter atlanticus TaxID=271091 RepID=UPI0003FACC2F|nr:tryptophan synthase subunit alpha [Psychrilyobacter atlanticus]
MNRIEKKFKELGGNKALITYITAGDPGLDQTEELIYAMERGGADIVELGIPYSDPIADGPVIQAAGKRALENGTRLFKVLEVVKNVREKTEIPLVFLIYFNTILSHGIENFIKKCQEAGVDGLIIPDLPLEERGEIRELIEGSGVDLIPLVAPNSKERLGEIINQGGGGFVYCISSFGVTGVRESFDVDLKSFLEEVRIETDLPLAVGFGISSREHVEKIHRIADGAIVGSAIVKLAHETNGDSKVIEGKVRELKGARNDRRV